jgi:predicted ester cyclase
MLGGAMNKAETIKQWFEISERKDWGAIAPYVADEYIWIDHTLGTVARTPDELLAATAEDEAWTDKRYTIDRVVEGVDGRLFVQLTVTQTLGSGSEWRGVKGSGQRVTWSMIDIFTFNDEGRVTVDEAYFDAHSIMRQLRS